MKRILVIGAGCIGIYLGTRLHAAGHEVHLFGRRKLQELGDSILIDGQDCVLPNKLFIAPQDQHFDLIFITTKLYHLIDSLELLRANRITTEHLFSIQNGLVDENVYKGLLDGKKLTIISVFEGIQLLQHEIVVSSTGLGWKTEDSVEGREVAGLLAQAQIPCTVEKNLLQVRAEKTIVNCCLNVLSAVEEKQFYELFADPQLYARIRILFNECYAVFQSIIPLDPSGVVWDRLVKAWSHTHHYSSTYQDLKSGRETEIEFLTGYVINLAKVEHIPVPENTRLYTLFQEKIASRK